MHRTPTALLAALALSAPAAAQAWFDTANLLNGTPPGEARGVADMDGDGHLDLLTYNEVLNLFTTVPLRYDVLLGDGTGRFTAAYSIPLGPGLGLLRPGLGDVTGDGLPDLLITSEGGGPPLGLQLHVGLPGPFFGAGIGVPLSSAPMTLELAELDGDGRLEVVVVHGTGAAQVLEILDWTGTALVSAGSTPIGTVPGVTGAQSLTVGDATGDGVPDAIVGQIDSDEVLVFPTSAGAPTPPTFVPTSLPTPLAGRWAVAGDIDGDGDDDLFVQTYAASIGLDEIAMLEHDGAGGFTAHPSIDTDSMGFPSSTDGDWFDPFDLFLTDWDGDGDLDVLSHTLFAEQGFSYKNRVIFLRYDGNGIYSLGGQTRTPLSGQGGGLGDFDGDGDDDYAGPRSIVWNHGTFDTPQELIHLAHEQFAVDWEGDGDLDFVGPTNEFRRNDGTGTFSYEFHDWATAPAGLTFGNARAFGDFDVDGRMDYLVTANVPGMFGTPGAFVGMILMRGNDTNGFDAVGAAAPGDEIEAIPFMTRRRVIDFDGDGDPDVLAPGGYWENDGTGFFSTFHSSWAGTPRAVADVDLDGDFDVVTATAAGASLDFDLWRDNSGSFASEPLFGGLEDSADCALADLDDDGDPDFAVGTGEPGGNRVVFMENVAGAFSAAPVELSTGLRSSGVFAVRDMDGDGRSDVLTSSAAWTSPEQSTSVFLRGAAGFVFEEPRSWMSAGVHAIADFDSDGDVEPLGSSVVDGRIVHGPAKPTIRQYGAGAAGKGGFAPVLGSTGPLKVGNGVELRVRQGRAGTAGLLAVGSEEVAFADTPIPGVTTWVNGIFVLSPVSLGGPPDAAGLGAMDLPYVVPPGVAGSRLYAQVFLVDLDAPGFLASSGGLELGFVP